MSKRVVLFSNVIAVKILWIRMKLKTLKLVAGNLPA